jgi:hypothetical protein
MSERSFDIGRDLKSVNLIQSSLDCRANAEQFNHQCFQRSAKICEPLDIEVKKPRICGRQIMRDNVKAESLGVFLARRSVQHLVSLAIHVYVVIFNFLCSMS